MIGRITVLLFLCCWISGTAQVPIDKYLGGWAGKMTTPNPFIFDIKLEKDKDENYYAVFTGRNSEALIPLHVDDENYLVGRFDDQLEIEVKFENGNPISFIRTGHHLSYLDLTKDDEDLWTGEWSLLLNNDVVYPTFYLSLDRSDDGNYGAYTYFKEPTFHYMMSQDFILRKGAIQFKDIRSNIRLKGRLNEDRIDLVLNFLNEKTELILDRLPYDDWKIGQSDIPSIKSSNSRSEEKRFDQLISDVQDDTLDGTHAIVIAEGGDVIFEEYFDGFTSNIPHDTRSLSKSFAAALMGIGIDKNIIENEDVAIKSFYAEQYPNVDWALGKDSITIHHLLTMSSGLDAIDFGLNRNSYASEGSYQNEVNWTKHILSAPMINKPGSIANYGSGNPHLIAPILDDQLEEKLEFFIHKNLFAPLQIKNYRIQSNNKDLPYFGGGWYLTPRDLIKFGQLYLNDGYWDGEMIISKDWVEKSIQKHLVLDNTNDKNEYGYLFWHKTYEVDGEAIESIEGRGSGGQYLFIIPDYDLVVVITSGNYRNGRGFQPEKIMQEYILPKIIK